ncbi:MAG TPA: hypothetical protein VHV57_04435 [Acidimicrobiales bacterium]|jgi:hypothetical protein|nr:hypothetical protein [Acidimicrobiales bacterium]
MSTHAGAQARHQDSTVDRAVSKGKSKSSKPAAILSGPAGLVAASTSPPDLTYWVLAKRGRAENLQLIDRVSGKVQAIVPESTAADAIAEVPAGPLLVGRATATAGSLEFHSSTSGALGSSVALSGPVRGIAVSANGATINALIVTAKSSSVEVISATSHSVVDTFPLPGQASRAIVMDDARDSLFVLVGDQAVDEINATSGQVESQFNVPPAARAIAMSTDGTVLYVLRAQGSVFNVSEFKVATEAQFGALPAAAHSVGLQVTSDGHYLGDFVGTSKIGNIQFFALPK